MTELEKNIERIIEKATDVLGSNERALEWIEHVSATLEGTPKELARTHDGTEAVLIHLGAISRHSLD